MMRCMANIDMYCFFLYIKDQSRSELNFTQTQTLASDTFIAFIIRNLSWLRSQLHDPSDGAHHWFQSSPLWVVSVISFLQQVLPTTEVGVFIENPGALQDFAGLNFLPDPFVLDRLWVFCQLQRLPAEVWPIVQPQLARPFGLKPQQSKTWCMTKNNKFIFICFHHGTVRTYIFDDPAGSDTVIEAHPALVVIVLPWPDDILVARVVVTLVQNPPATLHLDRVASVDEGLQVGWVPFAVVGLPCKVPVLVEYNLDRTDTCKIIHV